MRSAVCIRTSAVFLADEVWNRRAFRSCPVHSIQICTVPIGRLFRPVSLAQCRVVYPSPYPRMGAAKANPVQLPARLRQEILHSVLAQNSQITTSLLAFTPAVRPRATIFGVQKAEALKLNPASPAPSAFRGVNLSLRVRGHASLYSAYWRQIGIFPVFQLVGTDRQRLQFHCQCNNHHQEYQTDDRENRGHGPEQTKSR